MYDKDNIILLTRFKNVFAVINNVIINNYTRKGKLKAP